MAVILKLQSCFEAIGVAFLVAVEVLRDPGRRIAPWMPIDLGGDPWGNAIERSRFCDDTNSTRRFIRLLAGP
jgi:hypothetical protein